MSEKTLSEFLKELEEALKDFVIDIDTAYHFAHLYEERLASKTCHAEEIGNGQYCCSICNWDGWMDEEAITSYCPECGAKVARC